MKKRVKLTEDVLRAIIRESMNEFIRFDGPGDAATLPDGSQEQETWNRYNQRVPQQNGQGGMNEETPWKDGHESDYHKNHVKWGRGNGYAESSFDYALDADTPEEYDFRMGVRNDELDNAGEDASYMHPQATLFNTKWNHDLKSCKANVNDPIDTHHLRKRNEFKIDEAIRESLQEVARDKVIKNLDNTSPKDTIKQISKFGILDDSSYVPQRKSELLRNDRIPKREISPEEEENARKHLSLNEAENGGWVIDDSEAMEAYAFAEEKMGKETIDTAIIRAMSTHQLAEILAYIFRVYDFREWDEYKEGIGSEDDEDYIN